MSKLMKYFSKIYFMDKVDSYRDNTNISSGYIKIECKESNCKVETNIENIKSKGEYELYFLGSLRNYDDPILIGKIIKENNKGKLSKNFNSGNIINSGKSINDIDYMVIVYKENELVSDKVICPLAAYIDKSLKWDEKIKERLSLKVKRTENENSSAVKNNNEEKNMPKKIIEIPEKEAIDTKKESEISIKRDEKEVENKYKEIKEIKEESHQPANEFTGQKPSLDVYSKYENILDSIYKVDINKNEERDGNSKKENFKDNDNKDLPGQKNSMPDLNKKVSSSNNNNDKKAFDKTNLRNFLNTYFSKCEPFGNRRNDYSWWRVESIALLNNILYKSGIMNNILFNPRIAMANYKYKHILFGLYTDKRIKKEILVFGIPGIINRDLEPLDKGCRWIDVYKNNVGFSSFGYWLIYFEPGEGIVLKNV